MLYLFRKVHDRFSETLTRSVCSPDILKISNGVYRYINVDDQNKNKYDMMVSYLQCYNRTAVRFTAPKDEHLKGRKDEKRSYKKRC